MKGSDVMTTNEKQICNQLYQYIISDLPKCSDAEIFAKSSMIELGEFYFNKAIENVDGANDRLLKIVIKTIRKDKDISFISDFYLSLCKNARIKKLPKNTLLEVQQEYNNIFIQLYNSVLHKADEKISTIDTQLLSIKNSIKSVESKQPSLSLTRDLMTEENLLQEFHRKCNELRTQKVLATS